MTDLPSPRTSRATVSRRQVLVARAAPRLRRGRGASRRAPPCRGCRGRALRPAAAPIHGRRASSVRPASKERPERRAALDDDLEVEVEDVPAGDHVGIAADDAARRGRRGGRPRRGRPRCPGAAGALPCPWRKSTSPGRLRRRRPPRRRARLGQGDGDDAALAVGLDVQGEPAQRGAASPPRRLSRRPGSRARRRRRRLACPASPPRGGGRAPDAPRGEDLVGPHPVDARLRRSRGREGALGRAQAPRGGRADAREAGAAHVAPVLGRAPWPCAPRERGEGGLGLARARTKSAGPGAREDGREAPAVLEPAREEHALGRPAAWTELVPGGNDKAPALRSRDEV